MPASTSVIESVWRVRPCPRCQQGNTVLHIVIQRPPERVFQDVPTLLVQFSPVSYDVFVVASLPHRFAWSTAQFIDGFADSGLEGPDHGWTRPVRRSSEGLLVLGDSVCVPWALVNEDHDGMEMVRHDQVSVYASVIEMQGDLFTAVLRNLPVDAEMHFPIHHFAEERLAWARPNGHGIRPCLAVVVAGQSKRTTAMLSGTCRVLCHLHSPGVLCPVDAAGGG
jgi:hypothetical protein